MKEVLASQVNREPPCVKTGIDNVCNRELASIR